MSPANRKQLNLRIPTDLHDRTVAAAAERDLSVNWLITRAIEEFLDRLLPASEVELTRDGPAV